MSTTPTQLEAINRLIHSHLLDVHTLLPCKVTAYSAADQTISCQPQVQRAVFDRDDVPSFETLPELHDIPVAFPRAGGFYITLPIAVGDFVLVLFSETPTTAWRERGDIVGPGILERHGLNGAFAIPCGFPDTQKLSGVSTDKVVIGRVSGGTALEVDSSGNTTITGNLTVTGDISADGDVTADADANNISLRNHTHPSGTGPTGAPTPTPAP